MSSMALVPPAPAGIAANTQEDWAARRWRSTKARPAEERFWEKIEKTATCWIWHGNLGQAGYGRIKIGRRNVAVHRLAYSLLVGPIPEGHEIDHVKARGCTSRACVNPAHLEPVPHRVNLLRGASIVAENALKTHCKYGHAFTPENTTIERTKRGGTRRQCRACQHDRAVARWQRRPR